MYLNKWKSMLWATEVSGTYHHSHMSLRAVRSYFSCCVIKILDQEILQIINTSYPILLTDYFNHRFRQKFSQKDHKIEYNQIIKPIFMNCH